MRPIKLELEAFGSFAGHEVIDFEALAPRGLFVVSGDTGTGKTTIFDAMCWALYGEMPLKESQGVRSDHVGPEVRTEVGFTFECNGERYVVTRNPEQLRPAKRGNGPVNEPASAHLVRITDDGTEPVATNARTTSSECERLIGLDATQFQRVILLPQGEFSRFLLAGTDEREVLLSKLFGGRAFDDITEALKAQRDLLTSDVDSLDAEIRAKLGEARSNLERSLAALGIDIPDDLDNADRDRLAALIATIEKPIAAGEEEVARLDAEAKRADEMCTRAADQAKRFDEATACRKTLDNLRELQDQVDADEEAARTSARARPVAEAADRLEEALREAESAVEVRNSALDTIKGDLASLGITADVSRPSALTKQINALEMEHDAQITALGTATTAVKALEQAQAAVELVASHKEATSTECDRVVRRQAKIGDELPALRKVAVDPEGIRTEMGVVETLVSARADFDRVSEEAGAAAANASAATSAYECVLTSFIGTTAPRLAATLENGRPCPVCGSTEHPAPATTEVGSPTTFDEVQRASHHRDEANSTSTELHDELISLRARLDEDASTPVAELKARLGDLRKALEVATDAAERVEQLEAELAEVSREIDEHKQELARLDERAGAVASDLAKAAKARAEADEAAAGLDPEQIEIAGQLVTNTKHRISTLDELFDRVTNTEGAVATHQHHLDSAVSESPFDTVDAARTALVPRDRETDAIEAAERHRKARDEAKARLETLESLGVPDQRPDTDALVAVAEVARGRYKVASEDLTTARTTRDYTRDALVAHDELIEGSRGLRARAEHVRRAYKVCREGGSGAPMSLKRWVLTRELDRVTAAANVHLQRMTGHRYALQRSEQQGDKRKAHGLGLEVTDSNTGKARSTSSLSGGEQFQASLALALGLADVVSQGGSASGKRFEALFVDEGFGSLDTKALDDAIEALIGLHATGRMVGAITHVDAMKQNLHVGIQVTRREDGHGSTLVVRP